MAPGTRRRAPTAPSTAPAATSSSAAAIAITNDYRARGDGAGDSKDWLQQQLHDVAPKDRAAILLDLEEQGTRALGLGKAARKLMTGGTRDRMRIRRWTSELNRLWRPAGEDAWCPPRFRQNRALSRRVIHELLRITRLAQQHGVPLEEIWGQEEEDGDNDPGDSGGSGDGQYTAGLIPRAAEIEGDVRRKRLVRVQDIQKAQDMLREEYPLEGDQSASQDSHDVNETASRESTPPGSCPATPSSPSIELGRKFEERSDDEEDVSSISKLDSDEEDGIPDDRSARISNALIEDSATGDAIVLDTGFDVGGDHHGDEVTASHEPLETVGEITSPAYPLVHQHPDAKSRSSLGQDLKRPVLPLPPTIMVRGTKRSGPESPSTQPQGKIRRDTILVELHTEAPPSLHPSRINVPPTPSDASAVVFLNAAKSLESKLDDNVINILLKRMTAQHHDVEAIDSLSTSTFACEQRERSKAEPSKRFDRARSARLLLIPLFDEKLAHWTLATFRPQTARIEYFDSLHDYHGSTLPRVISFINWLFPTQPAQRAATYRIKQCSPQINDIDCGVHVLIFAKGVIEQDEDYDPSHSTNTADYRQIFQAQFSTSALAAPAWCFTISSRVDASNGALESAVPKCTSPQWSKIAVMRSRCEFLLGLLPNLHTNHHLRLRLARSLWQQYEQMWTELHTDDHPVLAPGLEQLKKLLGGIGERYENWKTLPTADREHTKAQIGQLESLTSILGAYDARAHEKWQDLDTLRAQIHDNWLQIKAIIVICEIVGGRSDQSKRLIDKAEVTLRDAEAAVDQTEDMLMGGL